MLQRYLLATCQLSDLQPNYRNTNLGGRLGRSIVCTHYIVSNIVLHVAIEVHRHRRLYE